MKPIPLIFLFINITCISYSQIYEIPNAEIQPTWVFPLCFEDATGARDTIYIAYDPDAIDFGVPSADTIFGEAFLPADTSKFMVYWDEIYADQIVKTVVWKNLYPSSISFHKAQLPVKFTWDTQLFYSDNLPFPDNDPLPNAWGLVHCGAWKEFDGCQLDEYSGIYLTDAPDFVYTSEVVDSILYASDYFEFFENGLDFRILQYGDDYNWMSIAQNEKTPFAIYPNPTSDKIHVRTQYDHSGELIITDMQGRIVKRISNFTTSEINISNLPPGAYMIHFRSDAFSGTLNFIKE